MLTTGYNFYTYISTNNVSTTWFISYYGVVQYSVYSL